jgi:hypothetical protein
VKPHIEIARESQTCGRCSGTGCGKCGGTGEEAAPAEVVSVTCICGAEHLTWSLDKIRAEGNKCPQCDEDWSDAIEAALAEPDGEPWDRADIDIEPLGMQGP